MQQRPAAQSPRKPSSFGSCQADSILTATRCHHCTLCVTDTEQHQGWWTHICRLLVYPHMVASLGLQYQHDCCIFLITKSTQHENALQSSKPGTMMRLYCIEGEWMPCFGCVALRPTWAALALASWCSRPWILSCVRCTMRRWWCASSACSQTGVMSFGTCFKDRRPGPPLQSHNGMSARDCSSQRGLA